jgi:hypothetical protein
MSERAHGLLTVVAIGVTLLLVALAYWSISGAIRALATGKIRMPRDEWDQPVWRYRDREPATFWLQVAIRLAGAALSLYILIGFMIPLWSAASS